MQLVIELKLQNLHIPIGIRTKFLNAACLHNGRQKQDYNKNNF